MARALRARPALIALCAALAVAACADEAELAGPAPPGGALRFVALDAGYFHACALSRGGDAYCWGGNSAGMLGDGTLESRARPTRVEGTRGYSAIDAGAGHTCALDQAGRAWCWGHNDEGQLGDGTSTPRRSPTAVAGGRQFAAISAGHAHTCALEASGDAWCWGDDSSGQLGDGPPAEQARSNVPVRVHFDGEFAEVRAGYYQSCGIARDGRAWCWGANQEGQIGDGTDSTRHTPAPVASSASFRMLAPGDRFVCGTTSDEVLCWGANDFGELARGPSMGEAQPVEVGSFRGFVATSIGASTVGGARSYACALRADDRAVCWGGRTGVLRPDRIEPTPLAGDIRFSALAAGPQFLCGLRVDGYAYCGGANASGQLGTGDLEDRAELSAVAGP